MPRPALGSGIHLGTVLFADTAGIDITHIPYKGSGPALTDLLGGHVQIYFSSLPPAIGLVKDGKLRALGVTGLKRSASFPDVPTVAEQGLPGFEAVLHYGIVAPAGTPRADRRQAQRSAARGVGRSEGPRATSRPKAPSRCQRARTNMPPTSTARKPSGRRW